MTVAFATGCPNFSNLANRGARRARSGFMRRVCLLLWVLGSVPLARAETAARPRAEGVDYWLGGAARLLPLGAGFLAQTGYGLLLWGAQEGSLGSRNVARAPWYGYVRPRFQLTASGFVNKGEAALEVFPVSFLGVTVGHTEAWRGTNTHTLDCQLVECRGWLRANSIRVWGALAAGPVFVQGAARYAGLTLSRTGRPFSEELSALAGNAAGDHLVNLEAAAGYRLEPDRALGWVVLRDRMTGSGSANVMQAFFYRFSIENSWTVTAGAGTYRSTTQPTGLAAFVLARWTGIPSLSLE